MDKYSIYSLYIHSHIHTAQTVRTYITYIHTYIHTNIYIHTVHTYIHTYKQLLSTATEVVTHMFIRLFNFPYSFCTFPFNR